MSLLANSLHSSGDFGILALWNIQVCTWVQKMNGMIGEKYWCHMESKALFTRLIQISELNWFTQSCMSM